MDIVADRADEAVLEGALVIASHLLAWAEMCTVRPALCRPFNLCPRAVRLTFVAAGTDTLEAEANDNLDATASVS